MQLGNLTVSQVSERLRGSGLRLPIGPFVFSIKSPRHEIAEGLLTLYDQFELHDDPGFVDFHVQIRHSTGIRRLIRPQSIFDVDGVMPFKPLPGKQALALLEWGMNWCIYTHAHQFLTIHGAVLEKHGRALLLPAPSGSGKSTLCAALMCRGWRLISDELILFSPETKVIHPLARPISLKNRSIDVIRQFAPDATLTDPIPDTSKGTVALMRPTPASVKNVTTPVAPCMVVFPCYDPNSDTILTPVPKAEVFMQLIQNAFNYSILGPLGFGAMAALVERVEGYTARYSSLDEMVVAMDERITQADA